MAKKAKGGIMAQPPLDPLGMWRDMLNQWEQGLNRLSSDTMQSTESVRLINQAMALSLRFQHGMTEMMARYLHALSVPTRSDLLSIGERLKAMGSMQTCGVHYAAAAVASSSFVRRKPG